MRLPFLIAALLLLGSAQALHAAPTHDLVTATRGDLPIVLSAPHGGTWPLAVRERTTGTRGTDTGTLEITEALAKRLTALLGAPPYVVAARFSRKYLDANRAPEEAYEDAGARPAYDAYHGHLREFVSEARARFPKGALLVDVHGQGTEPDTVHRGTGNGRTVSKLVERSGADGLTGKDSVFGVLAARGRTVYPDNRSPLTTPEDRRYNGGHIVRTYGSHTPDGIDAIQIELGSNLRRTPGVVDDLAEAIAAFYRAYLK